MLKHRTPRIVLQRKICKARVGRRARGAPQFERGDAAPDERLGVDGARVVGRGGQAAAVSAARAAALCADCRRLSVARARRDFVVGRGLPGEQRDFRLG